MIAIQFKKSGSVYVANATINANANLHVERAKPGGFSAEMTTIQNGAYCPIDGLRWKTQPAAFEKELTGNVFPKYLKLTSESMPTAAYITEA